MLECDSSPAARGCSPAQRRRPLACTPPMRPRCRQHELPHHLVHQVQQRTGARAGQRTGRAVRRPRPRLGCACGRLSSLLSCSCAQHLPCLALALMQRGAKRRPATPQSPSLPPARLPMRLPQARARSSLPPCSRPSPGPSRRCPTSRVSAMVLGLSCTPHLPLSRPASPRALPHGVTLSPAGAPFIFGSCLMLVAVGVASTIPAAAGGSAGRLGCRGGGAGAQQQDAALHGGRSKGRAAGEQATWPAGEAGTAGSGRSSAADVEGGAGAEDEGALVSERSRLLE